MEKFIDWLKANGYKYKNEVLGNTRCLHSQKIPVQRGQSTQGTTNRQFRSPLQTEFSAGVQISCPAHTPGRLPPPETIQIPKNWTQCSATDILPVRHPPPALQFP